MRSALAYRPRQRPLQLATPRAAVAYLGALAVAAFVFANPILLVAVTLAAVLAGYLAGVGPAVRLGLKIGLLLALLVIVVNALVVDRGETVLMRLGEWPLIGPVWITAEAIAAGAVIGLRAVAVAGVMAVYSAGVDPDRVLRGLRPFMGRTAITAGLVSRLVPVAAADAMHLSESAKLRGPAAEPVGRAAVARRLLAGSLDRSVDVAATLELRGYALPIPARAQRYRERSRHDRRFLLIATALIGLVVAVQISGQAGFQAFPRLQIEFTTLTLVTVMLILTAGLAPLRRSRRRRG